MNKKNIQFRGLVAVGMLILIFIMIITGTILWLAVLGIMNNSSLWNFTSQVHPILGFITFCLGMIHLGINKKMLINDLKTLKEKTKSG